MMKRLLLLLIAIAMTASISTQAAEAQKREMRAAWIATVYRIDWPTSVNNASAQKAELDAYLRDGVKPSPEKLEKIERMHRAGLHKLLPMPCYEIKE